MMISICGQFRWRFGLAALLGVLLWFGLGRDAASAGILIKNVDPRFSALISQCAPTVQPETMAALISAESKGHQFAIADAGPKNMPWSQRKRLVRSYYMGSLDSAIAMATGLISNGHTVSLGVTQINDRNLPWLGLSIRDAFDPCTNVAAGGKILTGFYEKAVHQFGNGPKALRAALSAYNSGSWVRGERDGYVTLVLSQRGKSLGLRTDGRMSAKSLLMPVMASSRIKDNGKAFAMSSTDFIVATE